MKKILWILVGLLVVVIWLACYIFYEKNESSLPLSSLNIDVYAVSWTTVNDIKDIAKALELEDYLVYREDYYYRYSYLSWYDIPEDAFKFVIASQTSCNDGDKYKKFIEKYDFVYKVFVMIMC